MRNGIQPNTLVYDTRITFPPIGNSVHARAEDYWSPKNYDNTSYGVMTFRRGLELSRNLVTARLLDGAIAREPKDSLDQVCQLALQGRLYKECSPFYPFVLGAQGVRLIDLAAFYAAIANEGERPEPHTIESITTNEGDEVYRHRASVTTIGTPDRASMYQLKTILQGVVARGTAISHARLAPYIAGKTGTSDNENDAWFVGFTNDVTIAVWVGYDNSSGKRRTLGGGQTGARAALPIFNDIVEAVWSLGRPKTKLRSASPQAMRGLVAAPIDFRSGSRVQPGTRGAFVEYFKLDSTGQMVDTQYNLVSRGDVYAYRYREYEYDGYSDYRWNDPNYRRPFWERRAWRDAPEMRRSPFDSLFGRPSWGRRQPPQQPPPPRRENRDAFERHPNFYDRHN